MKAPKVSHRSCAACLESGLCIPLKLQEQLEAMLGDKVKDFDLPAFYRQADAERVRNRWVIDGVWQFILEAFRAEMRARGWSRPQLPAGYTLRRRDGWQELQKVTPRGIHYPCPHAPPCISTWACGKKQLTERADAD